MRQNKTPVAHEIRMKLLALSGGYIDQEARVLVLAELQQPVRQATATVRAAIRDARMWRIGHEL